MPGVADPVDVALGVGDQGWRDFGIRMRSVEGSYHTVTRSSQGDGNTREASVVGVGWRRAHTSWRLSVQQEDNRPPAETRAQHRPRRDKAWRWIVDAHYSRRTVGCCQ